MEQLSVALIGSHYFAPRIHEVLPDAEIVNIESAEAFFNSEEPPADILILSAEEAAAYTYRYPAYAPVSPPDDTIMIPAAYALPRGEVEWQKFIGNWIDLKKKDGTIKELHQYWMLGGAGETRGPRWSVLRNVLGWGDS